MGSDGTVCGDTLLTGCGDMVVAAGGLVAAAAGFLLQLFWLDLEPCLYCYTIDIEKVFWGGAQLPPHEGHSSLPTAHLPRRQLRLWRLSPM